MYSYVNDIEFQTGYTVEVGMTPTSSTGTSMMGTVVEVRHDALVLKPVGASTTVACSIRHIVWATIVSTQVGDE